MVGEGFLNDFERSQKLDVILSLCTEAFQMWWTNETVGVSLHSAFKVFTGAMIIPSQSPRVILCPIHMYTFEAF